MKQKDALVHEVACMRVQLQQVRDDRDHQLSQVQALTAEVIKYKELAVSSEELEVCFNLLFDFFLTLICISLYFIVSCWFSFTGKMCITK